MYNNNVCILLLSSSVHASEHLDLILDLHDEKCTVCIMSACNTTAVHLKLSPVQQKVCASSPVHLYSEDSGCLLCMCSRMIKALDLYNM